MTRGTRLRQGDSQAVQSDKPAVRSDSQASHLGDDPFATALELYEAGRLMESQAICFQIFKAEPERADVLHLRACIMQRFGRNKIASVLLRRAIALDAGVAKFHSSLGDVLAAQNQLDEAVASYQQAVLFDPDYATAHSNLGVVLHKSGRAEQAADSFRRALVIEPKSAEVHFNLATTLRAIGRLDEATASYQRAVAIEPSYAAEHVQRARALRRLGKRREAIEMLRALLEFDPDEEWVRYWLGALKGGPHPERMPDEYVVKLFNKYADHFDEHLRDTLRYGGPELILEAVSRILGEGQQKLEVLDAGCGTGLCGPLLRPLARRLVGIDLSAGMLDQARARGVYDDLQEGELTSLLASLRSVYDLIVSADVLIYLGDLTRLFAGSVGALRPGGILAVSTERYRGSGYVLRPTGRFAHSPRYLRDTACSAGLVETSTTVATLRLESGKPVSGCVSVFRRPRHD